MRQAFRLRGKKKEAPDPAKRGAVSGSRQSAAKAGGLLPVDDDGREDAIPVFVGNDFTKGDAEKDGAGAARREKLPLKDRVPAFSVSGTPDTRSKNSAAPYCGRRTEASPKFGSAISDTAS